MAEERSRRTWSASGQAVGESGAELLDARGPATGRAGGREWRGRAWRRRAGWRGSFVHQRIAFEFDVAGRRAEFVMGHVATVDIEDARIPVQVAAVVDEG